VNVATWLQAYGYAAGPVSKGPTKLIGVVNIESLFEASFNVEPRMTATPNVEPVLVGEPEPC
jgi:hypothetical protein